MLFFREMATFASFYSNSTYRKELDTKHILHQIYSKQECENKSYIAMGSRGSTRASGGKYFLKLTTWTVTLEEEIRPRMFRSVCSTASQWWNDLGQATWCVPITKGTVANDFTEMLQQEMSSRKKKTWAFIWHSTYRISTHFSFLNEFWQSFNIQYDIIGKSICYNVDRLVPDFKPVFWIKSGVHAELHYELKIFTNNLHILSCFHASFFDQLYLNWTHSSWNSSLERFCLLWSSSKPSQNSRDFAKKQFSSFVL